MALPWYTTDLVLITDADGGGGDPGTWAELSGYTGGSGLTNPDTDYFIQGTGITSLAFNSKTGLQVGINYHHNASFTFATGECLFVWHVLLAGNAMDTYENGGLRLGMGPSNGNAYIWYVGGSNFGRNPYGGWTCYAIDPTHTPDTSIGTPTTTYQSVCCLPNMVNPISKGNLLAMDAIRRGRGVLYVTEGTSSVPCTFVGMSKTNDLQSNRWGLFARQQGNYLWQGLMSLGTAASACYFEDSNRAFVVDVTPNTYAGFNAIEVHNSSSQIYWTNVNITTLLYNNTNLSRGIFRVVDDATLVFDACNFIDMNFFIFKSNSELNSCGWLRVPYITQNSAVFDSCTFNQPTSAIGFYANNIGLISNSEFISDGTGHAIELSTAHAGNTYTFDGNTFTDYPSANGSTGNEAIYNNSGGAVTINLQNTTSVPSIRNGTNASTTVNLSVTLTLSGVVSGSEVRIQTARGSAPSGAELYHVETTDGNDVEWTYNYTDYGDGYYIDIIVHNVLYTYYRIDDLLLPSSNTSIPIQQEADRWYNNP